MDTESDVRHKQFLFRQEAEPGQTWRSLFDGYWPDYLKWFRSQGDAARPSYYECRKQLTRHMPELIPTYNRLVELAGGGDTVARLLSLYCPPAYLSGCTQAVWTDDESILVRNYDYNPDRLEGLVLHTCWNGQKVIAMSDTLWGVLDGINESGLSVSLAFGGRLEVGPGFGVTLILRYILEFCETTEQAIEVLRRVPSHMSYNVTVLDKSQRFATAYIAPDKRAVIRQVPVATNHQGKIEWPRHAWITATMERESAVQSVLADPSQTANGLIDCFLRPPVYNTSYKRGFGSLYTSVYRPEQLSATFIWPETARTYTMQDFTEGELSVSYYSH